MKTNFSQKQRQKLLSHPVHDDNQTKIGNKFGPIFFPPGSWPFFRQGVIDSFDQNGALTPPSSTAMKFAGIIFHFMSLFLWWWVFELSFSCLEIRGKRWRVDKINLEFRRKLCQHESQAHALSNLRVARLKGFSADRGYMSPPGNPEVACPGSISSPDWLSLFFHLIYWQTNQCCALW